MERPPTDGDGDGMMYSNVKPLFVLSCQDGLLGWPYLIIVVLCFTLLCVMHITHDSFG